MKKIFQYLLIAVLFIGFSSIAKADIDWEIKKKIPIASNTRDITFSKSGNWIFVLTDNNTILIYSINGYLKDKIAIENEIDSIEAGPREDSLFLFNKDKAFIHVLTFNFIQKIDTKESAFLGNPDAPVVMVVFTDYQ